MALPKSSTCWPVPSLMMTIFFAYHSQIQALLSDETVIWKCDCTIWALFDVGVLLHSCLSTELFWLDITLLIPDMLWMDRGQLR